MPDYAELVKALRYCSDISDFRGCLECVYEHKCREHSRDRACINQPLVMVDAADAIEELLAAVPHWISVEERLPEKHVEVLICTEDYGKNELGFANTAVWDGSEWIETWNRKESVPYVSHWMPLPAPPKEDADANT